ncbi:hypothetical protein C4569_04135, partial [Candidatus Parcubacteria bacterium]
KAVQLKNKIRAQAAMLVLAEQDYLDQILVEDDNLRKFLIVTWRAKYGKTFTDEFEKNPSQKKFMVSFIRYVMEERLEMTENDSARLAVKISNIYKKSGKNKYQQLAYLDLKDKQFKFFQ